MFLNLLLELLLVFNVLLWNLDLWEKDLTCSIFLPRTLCSEDPNSHFPEWVSLGTHSEMLIQLKSHLQVSGDWVLGPSPPQTHCDLRQLLCPSATSYKIRKLCLVCCGGKECLSVSNAWKKSIYLIAPHHSGALDSIRVRNNIQYKYC